ncbi:T7SS effector LXG polymorphic toxin [Streptococcus pantholopis]|uniref:T7SS effector LXG polymorphic toxin n=1 Tax=Streptococcus pantholopis TaxID=1811193 RepID=UPI0009EDF09B|nr:T7SS effector LXG polymorphic toxin [Streptococcus pantholopis]
MSQGWNNVTSATAIIDTDYLQGLEDGYSTIESSIATIDSETSKIYSSISDIISLSNPSSSDITTPLSEAKKVLTDTKSNMETFNGWTQGTEFSELLASQGTVLASLSDLTGVSYVDKEASAFYSDASFADGVQTTSRNIASTSTPLELLEIVAKSLNSIAETSGSWWSGFSDIWQTYVQSVADDSNYKRMKSGVGLVRDYLKIFNNKSHSAANLGRQAFEGLSKSWDMVSKSGKDLWAVMRQVKNTKAWSALSKVGSSKGWNLAEKGYKGATKFFDTVKNPLKSGAKSLGKVAQVGGWTMVAMEAGVYGYQGYTDEDSRTYHSVGKSAIHAGVETIKNAGPLEATAAFSSLGAGGAVVGFAFGTANSILGMVSPELKDKFYDSIENGLFDAYDGAAKVVKDVGQTVSDKAKSVGQSLSQGWNSVTSAFGF